MKLLRRTLRLAYIGTLSRRATNLTLALCCLYSVCFFSMLQLPEAKILDSLEVARPTGIKTVPVTPSSQTVQYKEVSRKLKALTKRHLLFKLMPRIIEDLDLQLIL